VIIKDIDWKQRAREFCQENGTLEIAIVEKAMREAAAVTTGRLAQRIAKVTDELQAKRLKANAPQ